jgi:biopolymer transport protein ExbD
MRKFSRSGHGAIADINITPLLDLAWVLLVIFIITTTAMVQGIEITLPEATPHETEMETSTLALTVQKTGKIFLDQEEVAIGELEALLRNLKKARGDKLPLVLKGDDVAEYRYVVAVLDVLQRIPIQDLAIATKPLNTLNP